MKAFGEWLGVFLCIVTIVLVTFIAFAVSDSFFGYLMD